MSQKNKPSETSDKNAEHRLALLGLALDTQPPPGPRPSLEEIDQFRLNHLPKKRAAQVKAYIARDNECYQAWSDLLASEQQINSHFVSTPKISIIQRCLNAINREPAIWIGGGFATAAASVFIGVVLVKTLLMPGMVDGINNDYVRFSGSPDINAWIQYANSEKNIEFKKPGAYDRHKLAILVGVHQGLIELQEDGRLGQSKNWTKLIQSYPERSPDCQNQQNPANCENQNQILVNLGRWVTLVQLKCTEPSSVSSDYLNLQQQRLEFFQNRINPFTELKPLQTRLSQWSVPLKEKALCHQTSALLASLD